MSNVFPWPWINDFSPGAPWELEPQGIFAGTSLRFCKWFDQYPATLWTLQYGLVPFSGAISGPIVFNSVPLNGGDWHLVDIPPSITKAWAPALYTWQCFAQQNADATTRNFVATGTILVSPDLTTAGAVDTRTGWIKILDEIDAMILATAGDPQHEVMIGRGTIAGQSIKGWMKADLIIYRDYALHMAGNEKRLAAIKNGAPNPRYKYATMRGFNTFPPFK